MLEISNNFWLNMWKTCESVLPCTCNRRVFKNRVCDCPVSWDMRKCLCELHSNSYRRCSPQSFAMLKRQDMSALQFSSISFLLNLGDLYLPKALCSSLFRNMNFRIVFPLRKLRNFLLFFQYFLR